MATPLKRKIGYVKAEKPVKSKSKAAVKPVQPVKKTRKSRTRLYENARNRTIYMPEDFWSEITPEKTGMTRNSFLVAAGRAKLAEMGIA
jgi:hypothetical protein